MPFTALIASQAASTPDSGTTAAAVATGVTSLALITAGGVMVGVGRRMQRDARAVVAVAPISLRRGGGLGLILEF